MCKLLLMTGIQDGLLALEFMKLMAKPMSFGNRDGIGYTGVKPNGELFSQRFRYNEHFMDIGSVMTPEISEALKPFESHLPAGALDPNYAQHGTPDFSEVKTLTMHTRMATCEKSLVNVHPFIDQDISLVHNGIIRNYDKLGLNKLSTCDSEAALQTYINQDVATAPSLAKKWLDLLEGSWAFGVLAKNQFGNRILDVVKGTSSLYFLEVPGLGKIFTTNDDDAKGVLREMNIDIPVAKSVEWNSMYRFDAITGELLETIDVKPTYYGHNSNHHGRTFGTSGSSLNQNSSRFNPFGQKRIIREQKDIDYETAIMAEAMGLDQVPDLLDSRGKFDQRKVGLYTRDSDEPLIDRLEVFDLCYDRNLLEEYECLSPTMKTWVIETDDLQGFKAARKLIEDLADSKGNAMG